MVPRQLLTEQKSEPPASLTDSFFSISVIYQTFPTIFTSSTLEIGSIFSETMVR